MTNGKTCIVSQRKTAHACRVITEDGDHAGGHRANKREQWKDLAAAQPSNPCHLRNQAARTCLPHPRRHSSCFKRNEDLTVRSILAGVLRLVYCCAHTQHVVGVQEGSKLVPEEPFQFLADRSPAQSGSSTHLFFNTSAKSDEREPLVAREFVFVTGFCPHPPI